MIDQVSLLGIRRSRPIRTSAYMQVNVLQIQRPKCEEGAVAIRVCDSLGLTLVSQHI